MSVGNINSYGDKKNNFSWQLKVLRGLDGILSAISGSGSFIAPQAKVTNILRETGPGTIATARYSAAFGNVGNADAFVKGVTLKPGETISFDAGALNNTLDAIDYDGTGTELLITYIS